MSKGTKDNADDNQPDQSNIGNTKTQNISAKCKRQISFQIVPEKQNTPIIPNVWSTKTQSMSEEEGDRNNAVRPSFQMRFEEQMFPAKYKIALKSKVD